MRVKPTYSSRVSPLPGHFLMIPPVLTTLPLYQVPRAGAAERASNTLHLCTHILLYSQIQYAIQLSRSMESYFKGFPITLLGIISFLHAIEVLT